MKLLTDKGFSMVELAIVMLVMGMLIAFAVPAVTGYRSSHMVRIASENIAGQLRLAREKAVSTGTTQVLRFKPGFQGSDYHVWNGSVADPKWSLPGGISYLWAAGTQDSFRLTQDGRSLDSGMIVVQDARGVRDTVSVQRSGLILN
jgi:prepilin-type N-terminal cleavage/methylation domain-containing protein